MIHRREFGKALAAGAGATTTSRSALAPSERPRTLKKNLLMHACRVTISIAGGSGADMTAKANLEYNLRHGVEDLTAQVRKVGPDGAWASR